MRTSEPKVLHGDCRELLKLMPSNSFEAVVTDPPYEYDFMNARWDGTGIAFDVEMWREVYRVLKPGAYAIVFGADRRIHRTTCALEDAGFIVRHQGVWVSAQVFPKSLDASKAIDAKLGMLDQRQVIGSKLGMPGYTDIQAEDGLVYGEGLQNGPAKLGITAPATPEAAKWQGYGTALKTLEPWVLVRKPLEGTLAENLMKWGVGALNIDGCRLPLSAAGNAKQIAAGNLGGYGGTRDGQYEKGTGWHFTDQGRWPSMMICSDLDMEGPITGVEVFGAQDDDLDGVLGPYTKHFRIGEHVISSVEDEFLTSLIPSMVVCPKATVGERELGCDMLSAQWIDPNRLEESDGRNSPRAGAGRKAKRRNVHPTVKPISLMRHLVRLITPRGGTVLDPFTGSGATGISAIWEGCGFIGCELTETPEQPFVTISRARLAYAMKTPAPLIEARITMPKDPKKDQLSLF